MALEALSILGQVFMEPGKAFARLKERPSPWLPLLALIVLSAGMMYWYLQTVDFAWLRDYMASADASMTPEKRAALDKFITPSTMIWSTMFGVVVGTPIILAISAVYFLLASKVLGSSIGYGKWFAFCTWTSVPRLLALPLMAVQILSSHGKLGMDQLNMTTLNFLIFHLPVSNPWASLLNGVELTSVWTIVLCTIGLREWTGRGLGACLTTAVLPYLIIYGLWAAKIVAFS